MFSIGSLAIPRPKVSLPTSLDNCPSDVLTDALSRMNVIPTSKYIESYDNPEYESNQFLYLHFMNRIKLDLFNECFQLFPIRGLGRFFHVSYLIMSVIGFIVSLIVGALLSLCIGNNLSLVRVLSFN